MMDRLIHIGTCIGVGTLIGMAIIGAAFVIVRLHKLD